jgi:hypothetical protein
MLVLVGSTHVNQCGKPLNFAKSPTVFSRVLMKTILSHYRWASGTGMRAETSYKQDGEARAEGTGAQVATELTQEVATKEAGFNRAEAQQKAHGRNCPLPPSGSSNNAPLTDMAPNQGGRDGRRVATPVHAGHWIQNRRHATRH